MRRQDRQRRQAAINEAGRLVALATHSGKGVTLRQKEPPSAWAAADPVNTVSQINTALFLNVKLTHEPTHLGPLERNVSAEESSTRRG